MNPILTPLRFHHVGIACKNLERARDFILKSHQIIRETGPVHDEKLRADLWMLETHDGLKIELVSGPAVENLLKKGITYYHHCYEIDDLDAALTSFKKLHCLVAIPPTEAILFGGRRVTFLITPMGLVELLESQ